MAKSNYKKLSEIKATSLANLQGTFAAIVGLGVAILYSLGTTIDVAASTDSVIKGMAFGLTAGILSIIVLPLIYFAIGWVVGIIQGFIYNVVLGAAGGLSVKLEDE